MIVFGKGLLACRIKEEFVCRQIKEQPRSLDSACRLLKRYKPAVVINCADYSGKNADDCERDKDLALSDIVFSTIMLAEACIRNKVKLVHVGSGCLFHFDYKKGRPIDESAQPNFFDLFYNRAMIYADSAVNVLAPQFDILVLRIRLPIDSMPHERNLLTKLIKFRKAIKEPNSVTHMPDFIRAFKHLLRIKARGVYNVVNSGALYYPGVLEIYKKYKPSYTYKALSFKELGITRTNLILSNKKLIKSGFKMPDINEVIEECVEKYVKY